MKKIILFLTCLLMLNVVSSKAEAIQFDSSYTEHLVLPKKLAKKAPIDLVNVYPTKIDMVQFDTFQVEFAHEFNSKYANVGDNIELILNEDLRTKEGTVVLPASTKVVTQITNIVKPKAFNRSGKVYLDFKYIQMSDGTQQLINAKVFDKNEYLSRGKLNALGKGLGSTLGGMAIGTAAGCGIGAAAGSVIVGGFAIGMPIGFVIGGTVGLVTPGLTYRAKAGDKINIQLTDNLVIYR